MNHHPVENESAIAAMRAQVLANARVLYKEHKLFEVLTSQELDGSELVMQQNWAYLVTFPHDARALILSCSEPCESREDAMRSLLDDVEAEMGEMITKELKDQKIPIERRRRRRERLVEQSRLARSA
ncbi:hypothetical protein BFW01_g10900 [Lasiodiplodia theobromae]|uniref:Uncharacterized protein n=2 Tax=Lasiodiplodia TaxID=66739 RepID=A0A5N5DU79_9PEZI|nr:uncharacterized protein LTHEOB_8264 [Lasiodiplodia theobromae]KAB2581260.1 hypothetical protein DBV05_g37 [Lasiodiplodia theobromae]KAF4541683.1 hypothetical protein LTHEOB_8264 [Lasiodiplodia theobromae]KAF9629697.1 hypothetical protein BFW01_g10900 [Lasiodiplodia theobromae]KAK0659118.1 hypothetical protein DIS24_g4272 [Lasiodiplodia hormozganensis]